MVLGWVVSTNGDKRAAPLDVIGDPVAVPRFANVSSVIFVGDVHFAYVCGKDIHICNYVSGYVTSVLRGHKSPISSVCVSGWSSLELISCDMGGCVKIWDLESCKVVRSIENHRFERVCNDYAVIAFTDDCDNAQKKSKWTWPSTSWKVTHLDWSEKFDIAQEPPILSAEEQKNGKNGSCVRNLIVGSSGELSGVVACLHGRRVSLYDSKTKDRSLVALESPVSALTMHPQDTIIVVSDVVGHVIVFRDSGGNKPLFKQYVTTQWHWHHQGIDALTFSVEGSYFLTGGEEATLVVWQLESGHKTFVPRLGDQIKEVAVSPDGSHYCVSLKNGTCKIIDARTRQVKTTFKGSSSTRAMALKGLSNEVHERYGIAVEPRSGCCVFQVSPGELSFVDVVGGSGVRNMVDVTATNAVMSVTKSRKITPAYVEKVAFSPLDGKRMVTAESRGDNKTSLKFWAMDRSPSRQKKDDQSVVGSNKDVLGPNYTLTTHVDHAHDSAVTSILVDLYGKVVVTTSLDTSFKVWEIQEGTGRWSCRSVGFLRNEPIESACLSPDGSLLAISNGNIVSLWATHNNSMIASLAHPEDDGYAVTHVCFYCQNLLACATKNGTLFVWNIFKRRIQWQMRFCSKEGSKSNTIVSGPIASLASLGLSKLLVGLRNGRVVMFGAGPTPEQFLRSEIVGSTLTGIAHIARSNSFVCSTGMDKVEILKRCDDEVEIPEQTVGFDKINETGFNLLALENPSIDSSTPSVHEINRSHKELALVKSSAEIFAFLDSHPSHVLPPLGTLVKALFNTNSGSGQQQNTKTSEQRSTGKRRLSESKESFSEPRHKRNSNAQNPPHHEEDPRNAEIQSTMRPVFAGILEA